MQQFRLEKGVRLRHEFLYCHQAGASFWFAMTLIRLRFNTVTLLNKLNIILVENFIKENKSCKKGYEGRTQGTKIGSLQKITFQPLDLDYDIDQCFCFLFVKFHGLLNQKKERLSSSGHLVDGEGTTQCCSTPWGDNSPQSVCYDQFAR